MGALVCHACHADNAADARFCSSCGGSLTAECPGCRREVAVRDRFCSGCGRPLATSGPAPEATPVPDGERKQVTVLFADLAGSMALAERADPEDWATAMDEFFRVLSDGVVRVGGTVDKFTGDGIMAIFGAPVSQEDHARRACAAALDLRAATAELGLSVRIGLNSGEAVVGGIGREDTLEFTALGHTVGLASRMESLAEPGTALLSEHTARLVRGHFALRDLGPVDVKGSSGPVRIFALDGAARPSATGGGSAALVGRAEEVGTLETALARAQEGQAQVIGIVGEAGIGKSRLCEEFARSVAARGFTVRRAAGVSHARHVALLPVLAFLRDYFGILESDTRSEARDKIAARILFLDPALDDDLPLLFDFLQVPDDERPAPRSTPELRLERVFAVLRRVTQRRSDRETLVLILEDLHWFDPASLDFVERLIPLFPGTRTLVLTNFRPEFAAPWSAHSYYQQLPLRPLDSDAVARLLATLLGRDPSLVPLRELITQATGGSPFFVEEVVRTLVEDGALEGSPGGYRLSHPVDRLSVPPTVQATLAARIDRLSPQDKSLLQTAAVIGRHFSEPVLRAAALASPADTSGGLARLCTAEFIQVVSHGGDDEYRFWHPLTQEVAYRSLLRARRAALHGAVARAVIATTEDRLDEGATLLAGHFEQAGDFLEAARWNERAGDFAVRSDVGESMRCWQAALRLLESAESTGDALRLGVRLRQRLIRFLARLGNLDEAERLYREGLAIAELLDEPAALANISFAYGTTRFAQGDLRGTAEHYGHAAHYGRQSGDEETRIAYASIVCVPTPWAGPVDVGLETAARTRAACAERPELGVRLFGISPLSMSSVMEGQLLALTGRAGEAWAVLDAVATGPRRHVDAEWTTWARAMGAWIATTEAQVRIALEESRQAVRAAEESNNTWLLIVGLSGVGVAELRLGRFAEAAETLGRALDEARRHQTGLSEEGRVLVRLAEVRLGLGDSAGAQAAAAEAVEVARRQGALIVECQALMARATIGRAAGFPPEAVDADLAAALTLARETGATAYEAEIEAAR